MRVVIQMEGGIIHKVSADHELEVRVVDQDVEGLEADQVISVLGEECYLHSLREAEVNPGLVDQVFAEYEKAEKVHSASESKECFSINDAEKVITEEKLEGPFCPQCTSSIIECKYKNAALVAGDDGRDFESDIPVNQYECKVCGKLFGC